ncbi:MAG: protein kinase [Pyrinomonadaceae bacterium]
MDDGRWQKIKSLFAEAEDLAADDRFSFLASIDDPELRSEVTSLLDAHEQNENLLEINALDLPAKLVEDDQHKGQSVGHYTIIRPIGHGGMGTVYLAERTDGEFKQKVALKLVRQTIADAETEKRFRSEREILASLNHPYIAQLHDGGVSDTGVPYFAMEYIEGKQLLEYARENRLSVKDKLKLILRVCSAVSFAHRNLTVHRDLKPSNILVTADGDPKLLDFGLAKIVDENLIDQEQTATVYRAFTPAYASPEQILGRKVTTSSDVYSLGVVFYELLTGVKPFHFEGKSLEEIIRAIDDGHPPRPSSIDPNSSGLRGDIDNIALKCLQKEPDQRYRSVEEFSGDIERFLDGRPIIARPASLRYRASKFLKRNKIAVASAAIVSITLIAALGVSLWQARIAREERDRAQRRFEDVRKLSNSLLFEITPKIEQLPGTTEAREILVNRASEYLDSLASESQDDIELRRELAAAYEKVGDLQGNPNRPNLGDLSGAIESYDKAYGLRASLPKTNDSTAGLAANRSRAANIRFVQNYVRESLENSEEAIGLYESIVNDPSTPDTIRRAYFETKLDHGQTFANNNQYETAIPIHRKVVADISRLDRSDPETLRIDARARSFLANALSWDGKQEEAELEMASAVKVAESLAAGHPNDTGIQKVLWRVYMLASSIHESIKNDLAYSFAEKAVTAAKHSVAADAADTQAKHNLARSYSRLGNTSILTGRVPKGAAELNESRTLLLSLIEREPKNATYQDDLGSLYTRIGDARKKQKDLNGALSAFDDSATVFERIALADEKNTVAMRDWAQALKNVAEVNATLGRTALAKAAYEKAIGLVEKLKAANALGKWDEKVFAEMSVAYEKLRDPAG